MNRTFFSRCSLLILCLVAFLVPFAMRGARYSVQSMKNDIKDWLPSDFRETAELKWFGDHFLGERFVVVTWPGCTEDDQQFQLLVGKLRGEVVPLNPEKTPTRGADEPTAEFPDASNAPPGPPDGVAQDSAPASIVGDEQDSEDSEDSATPDAASTPNSIVADDEPARTRILSGELETLPEESETPPSGLTADEIAGIIAAQEEEDAAEAEFLGRERRRARVIGDRFELFATGNYHRNWAGRNEKWLLGADDQWYFITPEGELFRWSGGSSLAGFVRRSFQRVVMGDKSVQAKPVALLGPPPTESDENPFYSDPRQLTARYFASITTGPQLLEEISRPGGPLWPTGSHLTDEEKSEIAHRAGKQRLKGILFGPDGKQTCIVLTLSELGKENLSRVIGRPVLGKPMGKLRQLAIRECGISMEDLKLGGPPVDNVAIDEEGTITLVRLVGFSLALGLVLSLLCFRSLKVTMIVFLSGGISAITSLSIVYWTRGSVDAVLMSMPALVYVLGLSGAVHIVNYYRDACLDRGPADAPGRALRHGWWPCTLAAFTTALGLLSLCTSNVLPIQKFGFYSALGVMATLGLLFFYLPAALQIFPPRYDAEREARQSGLMNYIERFWSAVCALVVRRYAVVMVVCVLLMIATGLGLRKINTSVQLLKLFDSDAKIIRDYRWLEQNLGKLVPMELVLRVAPEMQRPTIASHSEPDDGEGTGAEPTSFARERFQLDFLQRLELVSRVQEVVEKEFGEQGRGIVGQAMSAASFTPELPGPAPPSTFGKKALLRKVMNGKLEDHRDEMLDADFLRVDRAADHEGSELWRISLRLGALNDVDYGQFVHELKEVVEPVLFAYRDRERILHTLAENMEGDASFIKKRVLFLGAGRPTRESDPSGSDREDEETDQAAATTSTTDDDEATVGEATAGEATPNEQLAADSGDETTAAADDDPQDVVVADADPVSSEQQLNVYAVTLRELMINAGISEAWFGPEDQWNGEGKTYSRWTDDEWAERLKLVDCVVLLDDVPGVEASVLKSHSKAFVDARDDYRFVLEGEQPTVTAADRHENIQAVYTGVVPVVYKAQRTLLTSLINSIGWAFVMISCVMMILLRGGPVRPWSLINARGGLLSMIPNVFPVVVIFGTMGHLDIMVDIGSMMTASVAMGVAVDDTIHFLNWFRTGITKGMSRPEAISLAYRRVAMAMTQTTLIGGLGLSVFAFSTFTPTQRFGVLMLTLLCAALVGDLVFLPALLASPLGKYFCPRDHRGRRIDHEAGAERAVVLTSSGPVPHVPAPGSERGPTKVRHDRRHA